MTDATEQRNRAIALSRSSPDEAMRIAGAIEVPWYRTQAFATIARFAPSPLAQQAFAKATEAARAGKDSYQRSAVLAWPIRAALEIGDPNRPSRLLSDAWRELPQIELHGSRAEAIGLLLHAVLPASARLWHPLIDALPSLCPPDAHWRAARLYRNAAAMLRHFDGHTARLFVDAIPAGKVRERCRRDDEAGRKLLPRQFFY
jgi:hypothetical protein